jgi:uncharacterized membrane protein
MVGIALGVGGVTMSTILSAKAEKDKDMAKVIMKNMSTFSKVIWLGFILLVISGFGLVSSVKWPLDTGLLLAKHLVILLLFIVGVAIFFTQRRMRKHAPSGKELSKEFISAKKRMKALGTVSLILWYLVVAVSVFI